MAIHEQYHDPGTIESYISAGKWVNKTLDDYLKEHAASSGDKLAIIDRRWQLTFERLEQLSHRVACGLYHHGLRPGDVVSIQLPNWAEWLVMHCAITKVGAVTNSIGAMYRQKEVGYILGYAGSRMLLIPDTYRRFDYVDMVGELQPELPSLEQVFVVGEQAPNSARAFTELTDTPWEEEISPEAIAACRPDPNQVTTLMFTSGTTADPKGVMHTHNTMVCGTEQIAGAYGMTKEEVIFMPSPIGHTTALLVGARLPIQYGMTTVWQEHWDAEEAVELIDRHKCSFTLSATPFVHGLVHAPNASRKSLESLKSFACGGAPIPRELIKAAEDDFGLFVSALYGSSEALINSAVGNSAPPERRFGTDGQLISDCDGRIVDLDTGELVAVGEEGELQVRTPALYAGYYKDHETTRAVRLEDGWYATGDLCTLDAEGYVNVVGRKKDMIIRGGANISAREIEELLFAHPKISVVACVAMPDPVLSERVCAYVVCEKGQTLEFPEMVDFLRAKKVSNWKLPERLEIREEFPMTPSGKVQKYLLREEISQMLSAEKLEG